jgi:hypothetical protein
LELGYKEKKKKWENRGETNSRENVRMRLQYVYNEEVCLNEEE